MFARGGDKIDKETLKTAMRELGLKPTDEEVTQMIKDADSTGTGKVGFNEFYSMMTEKMSQIDSPSDLRTAFECYDTAGKGFIPADQFRQIMQENHGYKVSERLRGVNVDVGVLLPCVHALIGGAFPPPPSLLPGLALFSSALRFAAAALSSSRTRRSARS